MAAVSEGEMEANLIRLLDSQLGYTYNDTITDYASLVENFCLRLNKLNGDVLGGADLSDIEFDRILTILYDKTVYVSAKQITIFRPADGKIYSFNLAADAGNTGITFDKIISLKETEFEHIKKIYSDWCSEL